MVARRLVARRSEAAWSCERHQQARNRQSTAFSEVSSEHRRHHFCVQTLNPLRRIRPNRDGRRPIYNLSMALIEARERHEDLFEELIAEVRPTTRTRPRAARARVRLRVPRARGPGAAFGRGVHPPPVRRGEDLRRAATRRRDDRRGACCTMSSRTRTSAPKRSGPSSGTRSRTGRGRDEADADPVPEPRARGGGELPQDDRRDGPRRAGHPDQAGRPPAQHAHARVPRAPEAGPEVARDARGLCAARAPARHPRDEVGLRGPRLRAAASLASTPKSRRWWPNAAPTATTT